MIRNYVRVALRNLLVNKLYSFITIAGLAFGMACFLMMFSYVQFERSYDDFHVNGEDIYRVDKIVEFNGMRFPRSLVGASTAPLLQSAFPSMVNVVRLGTCLSCMVNVDENVGIEKRFFFADTAAFSMFTFPLRIGNPKTALGSPLSVVITPQTARRYFGTIDPMGRTIYFQTRAQSGKFAFTVTGVTEELPSNSTIKFDFLASFSSFGKVLGVKSWDDSWDGPVTTYIQLRHNSDPKELESQFPVFTEKYIPKGEFNAVNFRLVSLRETYYDKGDGLPLGDWGIKVLSYLLLLVSLLVLSIACINYTSLVSARSTTRAKEIGVRKVQGAKRHQLIVQFLGESVILSLISLLFAIALFELLLPSFRLFLSGIYPTFGISARREGNFSIHYGDLLLCMVGVSTLIGILSGLYPALVVSRFNPVFALKGEIQGGRSSAWFRKGLVIAQFAMSVIFTVTSLHVLLQIQSWKNADLSFDKDNLVTIPVLDKSVKDRYDLLKNRLLQNSDILGVTSSSVLPGGDDSNILLLRSGAVNDLTVTTYFVDEDFVRTLGLKIEGGRDVSKSLSGDSRSAILMNQAAMKACGWNAVNGQEIQLYSKINDKVTVRYTGALLGEIGNFRYRFFNPEDQPLILKVDPEAMNYILIRVNRANAGRAIDFVRSAWKDLRFDQSFEYSYLADQLQLSLSPFEALDLFIRFAALSTIIIAGLGLFALASFVIDRKTKEIGIRKAMGASAHDIVFRLTKSFVLLVVLANVIALPLSYVGISQLLQEIPYHVNANIWLFLAGSSFLILLSIVVVGVKSLKAATSNPVESLRYE